MRFPEGRQACATGKPAKFAVSTLRCTLLFLLPNAPALADGDPEVGRELVRRWCTTCHVVDLEGTGSDAGPALPALLGGKQRMADEIWGWLADPHPPMPNFDLSRQEIDDILAYLESLAGD
jgi:mono/diheme cytochrome c family protein